MLETDIARDWTCCFTAVRRAAGISGGYACGTSAISSTPRYPIAAIASIASSSVFFLNALVENARLITRPIVRAAEERDDINVALVLAGAFRQQQSTG